MVYENGTKALENINFYIDKGEFVFLVGSSAAGKSTIIKLIMRELVPSEGTIIINETNTSFLTHKQIPYFRKSAWFSRISAFCRTKMRMTTLRMQWK